MLAAMTSHLSPYSPSPYSLSNAEQLRRRRQTSKALGTVGRVCLITAAVLLVLGGLAIAAFIVLFIVALNSFASNK
jgi:hypothetical protein